MRSVLIHIIFMLFVTGIVSCTASKGRKSEAYYEKNRLAIERMRRQYDRLYAQQPFSIGFTDKSYKYYVMEVTTDTVRYIYNTDKSEDQLYEMIDHFRYDTGTLASMARQMKELKCLCVDKSFLYVEGKKEIVTFLSFKSVLFDQPFVENKYYILMFTQSSFEKHDEVKARLKKGDFIKIRPNVYFYIGNRFR